MRLKVCPLLIVLSVFFVQTVSGQAGYKGNKHEISFDLMHPIFQGMYQLEYKLSVDKNLSIVANLATQDLSKSVNSTRTINNRRLSGGTINSKGYMGGVGVAYNSPTTGMAMPVGHYLGVTYQRIGVDLKDNFREFDKPLVFDHNGNLVKFTYGRNFNVIGNLNLSLNLNLGLYFGSITPQWEDFPISPQTSVVGEVTKPRGFYPMAIPFLGYGKDVNHLGTSSKKISYLKYYAMPRIQIGYMF